jgi:nucleoside-diphosphate-sugar epimerase
LIFGCGYLGHRVARRWREGGQQVFVVTRDAERAARLAREGFDPIVGDVACPASLAKLPTVQTVLYAVGFDPAAGHSIRDVFVDGWRALLDLLPGDTGKIVYASTTGVYGQSRGEWVDEDSPCEPRRERARACLEAEEVLKCHALGNRAVILRLAGLYGPGRVPSAETIARHQPIAASPDGYLNLIHVEDAVEVILAAEDRARPPRTYVVADGNPVERKTYFEILARLAHAPPPRFERASTAPSPAVQRAESNKRACNARMLAELGVRLRYPSCHEGLAAILADEKTAESPGPPPPT